MKTKTYYYFICKRTMPKNIFLSYCVFTHIGCIWPGLKTFLLNLTFDVGPRFDNPHLDVTIQEVAKLYVFLCFAFRKRTLTYF